MRRDFTWNPTGRDSQLERWSTVKTFNYYKSLFSHRSRQMYLSWEREEVSLSCLWQGNTGDRARGNWIYSLKPRLSITDFCFLKSARHAKSRMVSLGSRSPEILVNSTTHRPKQNLNWKLVPYIKTLDSVHVHVVVCRAYFVMRPGSWWGLVVDEPW